MATSALQAFALCAQAWLGLELKGLLERRGIRPAWLWAAVAMAPLVVLLVSGDLFYWDAQVLGREISSSSLWLLSSAVWVVGSCGAFAIHLPLWAWQRSRPQRDKPAHAAASAGAMTRRAALAAPFAVAGYGVFIERQRYTIREVDIAVPNLPADLDGLRIAQVTDIHAGPYLEPKQLRRVVAMVNETKPNLALITGDLITRRGDPLHQTIDAIAELRADSGVWGCMGNHELFARCRGETQIYGRRKGVEFLRQESRTLRFGDAELQLVGVDYQKQSRPYLVGADKWIKPGAVNLLMSHNPDVFPAAAKLGYDLVIAGHTHGGQITIEIVEQTVNPGRFITPYVSGLYKIGRSSIYVSRGLGTVTLPIRLGADPEAAIIRLRKA